jgi:hypothetical protein
VTALTRKPPSATARRVGLPEWAIVELDGLLHADLLDDADLLDLSPDQLTAVAKQSFIASRLLFEAGPVIEAVRGGAYTRFAQYRHD